MSYHWCVVCDKRKDAAEFPPTLTLAPVCWGCIRKEEADEQETHDQG